MFEQVEISVITDLRLLKSLTSFFGVFCLVFDVGRSGRLVIGTCVPFQALKLKSEEMVTILGQRLLHCCKRITPGTASCSIILLTAQTSSRDFGKVSPSGEVSDSTSTLQTCLFPFSCRLSFTFWTPLHLSPRHLFLLIFAIHSDNWTPSGLRLESNCHRRFSWNLRLISLRSSSLDVKNIF